MVAGKARNGGIVREIGSQGGHNGGIHTQGT